MESFYLFRVFFLDRRLVEMTVLKWSVNLKWCLYTGFTACSLSLVLFVIWGLNWLMLFDQASLVGLSPCLQALWSGVSFVLCLQHTCFLLQAMAQRSLEGNRQLWISPSNVRLRRHSRAYLQSLQEDLAPHEVLESFAIEDRLDSWDLFDRALFQ